MDYKELVDQKEQDWSPLHIRMDADRNLVNLQSYIMRDSKKKVIPNIINITLNDAAVFAANVESSLGATTEQIAIETEQKKLDTDYIEDFIRAAFGSVGSRLRKQGKWQLDPYLDQQMCRRGRGSVRCCFRMEDGVLIPDITYWDSRFVLYEMGPEGLEWAAYKVKKSAAQLESESWAKEINYKASGKEEEFTDVWDKTHNEILVGGTKVYEQSHPWGYVPVVVQAVPLGSMLADADNIAHQGESIFFLIRDLIPELNRLVSMLQTINLLVTRQRKQLKSRAGAQAEVPEPEDVDQPGAITPVEIGGGLEPIQVQDVQRAAMLLHSIIEARIQRGSLSSVDLGTLTFPLSAVALVEIGEGRDQVFLPRLGARGLLKEQLSEMIIDQVTQIGGSVELGSKGHKRSFEVSKLQGEYDITFNYFIKSPKVDVARYSIAAAAGTLISERTKRRDVLQLEDPDGEERQLRAEQAELMSPMIRIHRTIKGLIEDGEDFEAELLSAQMGINMKQMLSGKVPEQIPPEEPVQPQPTVPLFGGKGGGKTSARKAAELKASPSEEVE